MMRLPAARVGSIGPGVNSIRLGYSVLTHEAIIDAAWDTGSGPCC